jgi:uncharacterized protein YkwD
VLCSRQHRHVDDNIGLSAAHLRPADESERLTLADRCRRSATAGGRGAADGRGREPPDRATGSRMTRLDVARIFLAISIGAVALSAAAGEHADYPRRLTALVNQYRASHGLPALIVDATVAGLAREHSAAMAKAGHLNHSGFPSRVRRSGLAMCVENVGWNNRSPEGQFDSWRASPGHNRNMLDARVTRMGVGNVADYVTMIACGK